jgi:ribose transport system permease protein
MTESTLSRSPRRRPLGEFVLKASESYALLALAVLLAVAFSVIPSIGSTFASTGNVSLLMADQTVLLVVALAILIVVVTNVWDFSAAANAGFGAVVAAMVGVQTHSAVVSVVAAVLACTAIGLVNALLITVFKIHSVIATLGMTIVLSGIVNILTSGVTIVAGVPRELTVFGGASFFGIPAIAVVAIIVMLLVGYLLVRTPYGRYLYAIGSNRRAARLVGIRTEAYTFIALVLGGVLAGIAGVLILARTGSGNPSVGGGYLIPAYAVIFLGAIAVTPGRKNVGGTLIAVVFLGILNDGLTLLGSSSYVNDLVNGGALLLGVALSNVLARQRGRVLTTE